ncbi:MAG: class II fructose-bisphosphate aldolase, partial [Chitinophagaceae bacterium]
MTLQDKLQELRHKKQALLATNFYNFETLKGILQAASFTNNPIILQLTKSSIDYMGLSVAKEMAESMLNLYHVQGWVHLDHGDNYDLIARCLDTGIRSVMIDASEKPLKENIRLTSRVVKLAEKYSANVEAELGYVAKLGQQTKLVYTDPLEAKIFVEETGVNALAVAIGSAHGFYKEEPKLDLDRLSEIAAKTNVALVLHGASGIPHAVLIQAVQRGICKINLA